jgi:DNA-binding MarR family transcriptional regulator
MLDRKKQIAGLIEDFRAANRVMFKVAPTFLNELHITYTEMIILNLVNENKGLSLKELASILSITSSAATQQVNNLVKRDYLVREESEADRRFIKIRVSREMEKQVGVFEDKMMKQFLNYFDRLTDDELAIYCKLNRKITDQILQR